MEIKFENIDKVNGLVTVTLKEEDYKEKVEKGLKDLRKKASLPGFRPGQVPLSLVQKRFGLEVKAEEVNKLLGAELYKYIREQKIEDYIATYKMTPEQYLDASGKGAVPLMEADPELFIDELAELTELEKTFKKALKKGWKEVVTVEFVRLAGPQPRDLQFDSDGSEEAIRTIRERADYSARPYRLKRYASLDDFKIA